MTALASHRLHWCAGRAGAFCLTALSVLHGVQAFAQNRAIADLRVSRIGDIASAQIMLGCRAGLLDSAPLSEAGELRIRLTLHPGCAREIGTQARDERYRPPSGELARIRELAFESSGDGEAFVTVRFDAITSVSVTQGARRDSIRLDVDVTNVVAELDEAANAVPVIEAAPRLPAAEPQIGSILEQRRTRSDEAMGDREPIRLLDQVQPGGPELYAVQLSGGAPLPLPALQARAAAENLHVYVNERAAGARRWQELRVGFFGEEERAREFLVQITDLYPDAVVVLADEIEQRGSGARLSADRSAPMQPVAEAPTDPASRMSPEERFEAARNALMSGENARAIELLGPLAAEPEFARREQALEMLGVAHERNGDLLQARSAYLTYLAARPEGPEATRVRQRLAGLITVVAADTSGTAASVPAGEGSWDVRGGVAQYYRDDRIRIIEDEPARVTQSALLSHVDLSVRREGRRLDFVSRVNGAFVYDMRDTGADERDDQALVSRAYTGIVDKHKDRGIRLGRQSLYRSGVLGRFDGATGYFRLKPRVVMNVAAGNPVDSPHSAYSDRRQFFGVSADLEQFVGRWDISVFSLLQQVDGITDREAIGGEAQFRGESWHLLTAVDLDLSYGEINSALIAANWRAGDKLTVNTRANFHVAPFVMTRNAIIGQTLSTVEDLLDIYSESEIRTFARDRSAEALSASVGFSWSMFDRFQMNSDVTYMEYDATVASAGVAAIPASDPQLFFSLNFIGSSIFRGGDTAIFGFRHNQTRTGESAGIVVDFRLPIGTRIRINPRLAVTQRRYWVDWSSELFVQPTLRLLMRFRRQHRFEAEVGALWSNRGFTPGEGAGTAPDQETSARFFNVGYWWEF